MSCRCSGGWVPVAIVALVCSSGVMPANAAEDDRIFKDEADDKKEAEKEETGFKQTMERFEATISWLEPTRKQLHEDVDAAREAKKPKREVARLEKKAERYDVYIRALIRMRRRVNEAAGTGKLSVFVKQKRVADKLLALFDKWREAREQLKDQQESDAEADAKAKRKETYARRNVERAIIKLGLHKPPEEGEFPEGIESLIDSGELGDPGKLRRQLKELRKQLKRRGRGRW